jgi:KUP system potassium uptake protein
MMVCTITAVAIFQNSVALGLSYGVCVSTLMLGTDLLIALGMVVVWEAHPVWPAAYLCCFGFIDSVFFTASLTKIPRGTFCTRSNFAIPRCSPPLRSCPGCRSNYAIMLMQIE